MSVCTDAVLAVLLLMMMSLWCTSITQCALKHKRCGVYLRPLFKAHDHRSSCWDQLRASALEVISKSYVSTPVPQEAHALYI